MALSDGQSDAVYWSFSYYTHELVSKKDIETIKKHAPSIRKTKGRTGDGFE